jgi:hypothetical protein
LSLPSHPSFFFVFPPHKKIEKMISATELGTITLPVNGKGKTKKVAVVAASDKKKSNINPLFAPKTPAAEEQWVLEQQKILQRQFTTATKFEKISAPTTSVMPHPICGNAFLSTVHEAFANERPLVLSPDHVWSMIAQGVAIHVNENAEALRGKFVMHADKAVVVVRNDALIQGKESPWELCFPLFAAMLQERVVGGIADLLPAFSTSGETERIVHTIAFMDAVKAYFSFEVHTRCGIPRITLLGTPEDWNALREQAGKLLSRVAMDFWWNELSPILNQFCALSSGVQDASFWGAMYYFLGADMSGESDRADGWIVKMFPYLSRDGKFVRNNFKPRAHPTFPSSLSAVPFVWDYYNTRMDMNFIAGGIGVGELKDADDSVTPALTWAVAYEK